MKTYRRKKPGETEWRVISVTEEKPIDQMTAEEIRAAQAEERRRRQAVGGCCGKTEADKSPPVREAVIAQIAQDAKTAYPQTN